MKYTFLLLSIRVTSSNRLLANLTLAKQSLKHTCAARHHPLTYKTPSSELIPESLTFQPGPQSETDEVGWSRQPHTHEQEMNAHSCMPLRFCGWLLCSKNWLMSYPSNQKYMLLVICHCCILSEYQLTVKVAITYSFLFPLTNFSRPSFIQILFRKEHVSKLKCHLPSILMILEVDIM